MRGSRVTGIAILPHRMTTVTAPGEDPDSVYGLCSDIRERTIRDSTCSVPAKRRSVCRMGDCPVTSVQI